MGCGNRLRGIIKGVLDRAPEARLMSLYDPDEKRSETYASMLASEGKVIPTPEELFARKDLDWVLIGFITLTLSTTQINDGFQ